MTFDRRTLEERVADSARTVRKPTNKGEAFQALRRIVNELSDLGARMPEELVPDLARLWAHYLPPTPRRAKTAFDWCAQAMGKNDTRRALNYVCVTVDCMMATDGHSLHIAPTEGFEPGHYDAQGIRVRLPAGVMFPDVDRVIPNPEIDGRMWYRAVRRDTAEIHTREGADKPITIYRFGGVTLDSRLVDRLYSLDPAEALDFNVGGPVDPVLVMFTDGRRAVVMPLRK